MKTNAGIILRILSLSLVTSDMRVLSLRVEKREFECTISEDPSLLGGFDETCRSTEIPRQGFRFYVSPGKVGILRCQAGANPYSPHMFDHLDLKNVTAFIFVSCPLPDLPFSEMLGDISVESMAFITENRTSINPNVFANLHNLTNLNLSHNRMKKLPGEYFRPMTGLEVLSLSYNRLVELPSKIFQQNLGLKHLALDSNRLMTIPKTIFKNLKQLQVLRLDGNLLTSIAESHFKYLSSLKILNLSSNSLRSLDAKAFHHLGNIEVVHLNKNELEDLPDTLFKDNLGLREIDLDDNSLEELPKGIFSGLTKLESLSLRFCQFHQLPNDIFWDLTELKHLGLSGNEFEDLPSDLLEQNLNLVEFQFEQNFLEIIPKNIFLFMDSLKILNLHWNTISKIEKEILTGLGNLEALDLSNNRIALIEKGSFSGLHAIVKIDLRNNWLMQLDSHAFSSNKNLKSVDLSYNELQHVNVLISNSNVKVFNFHENSITEIVLPKYEENITRFYDFSHNRIHYVDARLIPKQDHYANTVYLHDNKLNCDCNLLQFFEVYSRNKEAFSFRDISLDCRSPLWMKGLYFEHLSEYNFECEAIEGCSPLCECHVGQVDRTMDCSHAGLDHIPEAPEFIAVLIMSNNSVSSLANLSSSTWRHLHTLHLDHNDIISERWSLPHGLKRLFLHNNKLTWNFQSNVLSDNFVYHPDLEVTLGENNWVCDCSIYDMKLWLTSQHGRILDAPELRCHGQRLLQNHSIIDLEKDEVCSTQVPEKDAVSPTEASTKQNLVFLTALIPGGIVVGLVIWIMSAPRIRRSMLTFLSLPFRSSSAVHGGVEPHPPARSRDPDEANVCNLQEIPPEDPQSTPQDSNQPQPPVGIPSVTRPSPERLL